MLTLNDGAVVVKFGAVQSPYYVSAVRECVWFTGFTSVSSDIRFFCLTSGTRPSRGRRAQLTYTLCLSLYLSLTHTHTRTHMHLHTHKVTLSLRSAQVCLTRAVCYIPLKQLYQPAAVYVQFLEKNRHFRRIRGQL